MNFVSYWDASRFANWLHNAQPSGAPGPGTTETGAYTLNGYNGPDGREIQRNRDWHWAVTSEDEWYKAAYHKNDGVTGNYFDYPTSSDAVPSNDLLIRPCRRRTTGASRGFGARSWTAGSRRAAAR